MVCIYFYFCLDLLFTSSILYELKKEGVWTVLAILYNPVNIALWVSFINWLFQITYYEEDEMINNTINASTITTFNDHTLFEIDDAFAYIRIIPNSTSQVFFNVITIVDYLITLDMSDGFTSFLEKLPEQQKGILSKVDNATGKI